MCIGGRPARLNQGAVNEQTILAGLLAASAHFASAGTVLVVMSAKDKLDLKDGLVAAGANFVEAKPWSENVMEDRELISCQNPQSAKAVALAMLKKLH